MSKSSIADAIMAWETALMNAKASAPDSPGLADYMAPLEKTLADAKALSASLETHKALKQQESRDRLVLMQQGNEQVSRLRSSLRAFFGPRSERNIEFGGRPVRPRTGKKPVVAEDPPPVATPTPEAPASPGAAASPGMAHEAPRNPTTA